MDDILIINIDEEELSKIIIRLDNYSWDMVNINPSKTKVLIPDQFIANSTYINQVAKYEVASKSVYCTLIMGIYQWGLHWGNEESLGAARTVTIKLMKNLKTL